MDREPDSGPARHSAELKNELHSSTVIGPLNRVDI